MDQTEPSRITRSLIGEFLSCDSNTQVWSIFAEPREGLIAICVTCALEFNFCRAVNGLLRIITKTRPHLNSIVRCADWLSTVFHSGGLSVLYGDMPMFQALKHKMDWHQTRQGLLSQNVANADTPGYQGGDLAPISFDEAMRIATPGPVGTRITNDAHVSAAVTLTSDYRTGDDNPFEITPDGNEVTIEEQMMKVASNQMDYQAATTLYKRAMGMIRTALGK